MAGRCIAAEENTVAGSSGQNSDETDELTRLYSELSLKTEAWKKLKEDLKILTHKYTELKKDAETNKEILRKYEKECSSLNREAQNAKDEANPDVQGRFCRNLRKNKLLRSGTTLLASLS